jgi:hypothetical protein
MVEGVVSMRSTRRRFDPGVGLLAARWVAIIAALLSLMLGTAAFAEDAPDPRTRNEAARVAQQIEREVGQAQLTRERRTFATCTPQPSAHERYRDTQGVTRRYDVDWRGNDGRVFQKIVHYYDRLGRLRLVVADVGAISGAREQVRIVFALDGSRLSETRRHVAGTGAAAPTPWPDDLVARNPERVFTAETPRCGLPGLPN